MKLRKRKPLNNNAPTHPIEHVESVVVPKLLRRSRTNSKKLPKKGTEKEQPVSSDVTKLRKRKVLSNRLLNDAENLNGSGEEMQRLHDDNNDSSTRSPVQTAELSQSSENIEPNLNYKRASRSRKNIRHNSQVLTEKYTHSQDTVESTSIVALSEKENVSELTSILEEEFGPLRSAKSSTKINRSNFKIRNCSVVVSEEDDASELIKVTETNISYKNDEESIHHIEELTSILDEEFASIKKSRYQTYSEKNLSEEELSSDNMDLNAESDCQQESESLTSVKIMNHSKIKSNKHTEFPALSSWLATAQRSTSKSRPAKVIESGTNKDSNNSFKMKHLNMHTPLETRQLSRLASTPHISSASDTNCEEDLFGFENLLEPVVNLSVDFSPIPNPRIRKSQRKKKSPFCDPKKVEKPWVGLLNVTTSHFNSKPKKTKSGKKQGVKNDNKDIIDLSDVCLFEDDVDEFNRNENDVDEFDFDAYESSKPKRYRQFNKAAPKIHFNIEDQLPWKEIMEHELVIESV